MGDFAPAIVRAGRVIRAQWRWVVREIEDAEWQSDRTAVGIDAVGRDEINARVDVVAGRRVDAVGQPSEVVEGGKLADERERSARDSGRLKPGTGESSRGE